MPQGESGEVWFRTPQATSGYLGKPEATAELITPDGWVRTGDLGRVDEDGFLFIEDRIKDMIITGGENVYSPEVERVLAEHPAVQELAVIGVPDDKWGETVKAVVAFKPDLAVSADELIAYARERLAGYKTPTSIDVVDALPRNPSGKILKRDLRKPYWGDRTASRSEESPGEDVTPIIQGRDRGHAGHSVSPAQRGAASPHRISQTCPTAGRTL